MTSLSRSIWILTATTLVNLAIANGADTVDVRGARQVFHSPPREYSTGPLWVWNDMLTEEQIRSTLRDLAEQKVKQVWVHPRPGLMTPYLGKEWFDLWRISLDEAAKLDMNVWIYDENSYPSGFAGGWVPELMPEARGRGLNLKEVSSAPTWTTNTVAIYRLSSGSPERVTPASDGPPLPEGKYLVATEVRSGDSPWHGNRSYVNLLSPGVTEKFLDVTMNAYKRELGAQFGKRIPGVFTDEPNIIPAGGLPWSEILAGEFQRRWGYDLLAHLPSLRLPVGDWRRVRHNYYQVLHEQFVEHWAKPYWAWCETNGLAWTGHYWEHDWPHCVGVPDNMGMYAWHQWPAIDCLMNQYAENTHAQFGNARMVKELSSVANQLGRKRTLCEVYGAGGWDLRFEDMKRIGDWLQVLGVNTLNQHLNYITLRGARKRDHPLSFSYHAPWWDTYHISAEYFARLSAALSQGEQVNRILILAPTTTAWMYQGDNSKLGPLGDEFFRLIMALEAAQVEYDLGSEDVLERHGSATAGQLRVGLREYDTVVVPPRTESLNRKTLDLLRSFLASRGAGEVLCMGEPPSRVDGQVSTGLTELASNPRWRAMTTNLVAELAVRTRSASGLAIERAEGDQGILFHHRRTLRDGELLFLVNTSIDAPTSGTLHSRMRSVDRWDLTTGVVSAYPYEEAGGGVRLTFQLPPSGSLLLCLKDRRGKPERTPLLLTETLRSTGEPETRRVEPNVLTLDYVDVSAGGETRRSTYFYQANQFVWQKNGMDRNPWDSAVQFKDELISRKFPANSGFSASYRFTIAGQAPKGLQAVIERPDLYRIEFNGEPIEAAEGQWWLDKAFGKLDLEARARPGENVLTIHASPFTMFHELEPAYILGNFKLQPEKSGFVITPDEPITLGRRTESLAHGSNPDGTMWLSAGIGYQGTREDPKPRLLFDLGAARKVSRLRVWNYNESNVRDLTGRGAREIRVTGKAERQAEPRLLGTFELQRAGGGAELPQELALQTPGELRYVEIEILSNHSGVRYPAPADAPDNAFVGLAEVQFLDGTGQRIEEARVGMASSELTSHGRLAKHLTDGSGMGAHQQGWNEQGHPFYAAGVGYRQRFELQQKDGRYYVVLPKWYGSVAAVTVNGKAAGHIDAPPWEREVTSMVKKGSNEIEVTVIGTLKNTLGPHHNSPALGTAWPGQFQNGPNPGPPAGNRYSTVAYGLFEPFVLKRTSRL